MYRSNESEKRREEEGTGGIPQLTLRKWSPPENVANFDIYG